MLLTYVLNCFWLIVPVLLLNAVLMKKLPSNYQPEFFSKDIPRWVSAGENILRILVIAATLVMPLGIGSPEQRVGLAVYLAGLVLYSLSWIMQVWFPKAAWSESRWGFMAPSYTPILWLVGIAIIGRECFVPIPYWSWIYLGFSTVFLIFHNLHTWIVFTHWRAAT